MQELIRQKLTSIIADTFAVQLPDIVSEAPPRVELGDLAFPVAFELAKRIKASTGEKRNPRELAAQLAEALGRETGISRVEVAGAGYLNVFFDRGQLFKTYLKPADVSPKANGKMIVEHTSINPNKAAHIGH